MLKMIQSILKLVWYIKFPVPKAWNHILASAATMKVKVVSTVFAQAEALVNQAGI